jgi:hypothetical protein
LETVSICAERIASRGEFAGGRSQREDPGIVVLVDG